MFVRMYVYAFTDVHDVVSVPCSPSSSHAEPPSRPPPVPPKESSTPDAARKLIVKPANVEPVIIEVHQLHT